MMLRTSRRKVRKKKSEFTCEDCQFSTQRKSCWSNHIKSKKHLANTVSKKVDVPPPGPSKVNKKRKVTENQTDVQANKRKKSDSPPPKQRVSHVSRKSEADEANRYEKRNRSSKVTI